MVKRRFIQGTDSERGGEPGTAALVGRDLLRRLVPIVFVAFVMFLVTGVALPVLPVYVHRDLGFGAFAVGLVAGAQFTAALLTRFWSGRYADTRGAKHATVAGLLLAVAAGLLYLVSLRFGAATSVSILFIGRAVLGAAESCVVTDALSWGLALAGPRNAGKAMSWVGLASCCSSGSVPGGMPGLA